MAMFGTFLLFQINEVVNAAVGWTLYGPSVLELVKIHAYGS